MLGVPDGTPGGPAFVPAPVASRTYIEQGILTESPRQLVLTVYDFILSDARKGHAGKVRKWFQELLNRLDYGHEQSWDLQALYETCLELVDEGQLDELCSVMRNVRAAWNEAFHLDALFNTAAPMQKPSREGFEMRA